MPHYILGCTSLWRIYREWFCLILVVFILFIYFFKDIPLHSSPRNLLFWRNWQLAQQQVRIGGLSAFLSHLFLVLRWSAWVLKHGLKNYSE